MKLAIASGKGGTGKTTVAANLALTAPGAVQLLDCDVEEPNAHLFLRPTITSSLEVTVPLPAIDTAKCTRCGACAAACRFHAIISIGGRPLLFPELCHGCGGCIRACREDALREVPRRVGVVEAGRAGAIDFARGVLDIGSTLVPPLIREVKARADPAALSIIDCPPGAACAMVAAARGCDVALLVAEPTAFGLGDLEIAIAALDTLGIPFGVVINRAGSGDARVVEFCRSRGIALLGEIPDEIEVARAYARGQPAVEAVPAFREHFAALHRAIEGFVGSGDGGHGEAAELVILGGKGGTGKTSIAASLAVLAGEAVLADLDVDAADLYHLFPPTIRERQPFVGGLEARLDVEACTGCGDCVDLCRFGALRREPSGVGLDQTACEGCGVCVDACSASAIELAPATVGEWFISATRIGPMVHARLHPGAENSGKLVAAVREEARKVAAATRRSLVIADGPPGIGCQVISALTGAAFALLVTEPTVAGLHDLERLLELIRHFGVRAGICLNKWDLNEEAGVELERKAAIYGVPIIGRVRYDRSFTRAQLEGLAVVETESETAAEIRQLWERLVALGATAGLGRREAALPVSVP